MCYNKHVSSNRKKITRLVSQSLSAQTFSLKIQNASSLLYALPKIKYGKIYFRAQKM